MRISYAWLSELFPAAPPIDETAEILTNTGLEVEGIEAFESIPGGLSGLVVGEVLEVWKHPGADRLNLTRIHIGEDHELQIVCGAPNVASGQKVVVATEGATLYPLEGEPFTIRKGKIRGEVSQGMLCAEDEIGYGKGSDGIMVLPQEAVPGTPIAQQLEIYNDQCLEIGLTPNRTDAMSHFGVARDLRAAMMHSDGAEVKELAPLEFADLSTFEAPGRDCQKDASYSLEIDNTEACHRYAGLLITGVKVDESPAWLQNRLKAIDLQPINNVVDVTNYVMHELGQPLHAFDADKIAGQRVVVRSARQGEKFITLDGVERELHADDLMICDAEKPMCIAGVFGGQHSGIGEESTAVFLESAIFDPVYVRRTARRHQLNTDASYRFERGADAEMTLTALKRAAQLICALTGGCVSSPVLDEYPTPHVRSEIEVDLNRMNKLIGRELDRERVAAILLDLDFEITADQGDKMIVLAPLYRRDVKRMADVAEEVLRIYGYNSIPIPDRMHSTIAEIPKPDLEAILNKAASVLVARGFTEIMNNSLTRSAYADLHGADETKANTAVKLVNPLSSDLAQLRQSMLFQGLETIARNSNFKQSDLRLFEYGSVYHDNGERIVETPKMALWITGRKQPENWNSSNEAVSFVDLRSAIEALLQRLGALNNLGTEPVTHPFFSDAIQLKKGEKTLVTAGALQSEVLTTAGIKQPVYYAEIEWNVLVRTVSKHKVTFTPLPKFPSVRRDLSMLFDHKVHFRSIAETAKKAERKLLKDVGLFDVYEGKNLQAGKKSYAVSFVLRDESATLTEKKIDGCMQRIQKALETELGGELRS